MASSWSIDSTTHLNHHPWQWLATQHAKETLALGQNERSHEDAPNHATTLASGLSASGIVAFYRTAHRDAASRMSDDHSFLAFLDDRYQDLADGIDIVGEACERQFGAADCRQGNVDRGVARLLQELHNVLEGWGQLPGSRDNDDRGFGHFETVAMYRRISSGSKSRLVWN